MVTRSSPLATTLLCAALFAPAVLAQSVSPELALTFYADRVSFNAAYPGLVVEDFETLAAPLGGFCFSPSPVNATTGNGCVPLGAIAPGLEVAAVGPNEGQLDALIAHGAAFFGRPYPSVNFGTNYASDATELRFDPAVEAAAFDAFTVNGLATTTVEIYDATGTLLGTASLDGSASGEFLGLSSDGAPVGRILLSIPAGTDSNYVDDVAFGDEIGCGTTLSALTVDDDTPAPGQPLSLTFTVTNDNFARALTADLSALRTADSTALGPFNLGSGVAPPNLTLQVSRRIRVPATTEAGEYVLTVDLADTGTGMDCASGAVTINVGSSRRGDLGHGTAHDVWEGDDSLWGIALTTGIARAINPRGQIIASVAPNPFAAETQIAFTTEAATDLHLAVYDVLGREVAVLVDGALEAGAHSATFNGRGLAVGTYVYRLSVDDAVQTGRFTLTR